MIFGKNRPQPIAEHEARGEIERVYHEIRQTMRVSGVNLNFRTWAGYGDFLPAMWEAARQNVQTRRFEQGADQLRAQAALDAAALGPLGATALTRLGESQRYQIQAALELYHYINPKLLLLTSAVRLALDGHEIGTGAPPGPEVEQIERGVPPRMAPMEMESDEPDDARLRELFADIQQTLDLPSVNSDYRTLALWPGYLSAAWDRLKPIVARDAYRTAADRLREAARSLARELPYPIPLSRAQVEALNEDADRIGEVTERFEGLLPPLIINIALLMSDWQHGEPLAASPFPARTRHPAQQEGAT